MAGAISMAAGEYLATKSQDELFEGEIAMERRHIQEHRAAELHELADRLAVVGLEGELQDRVVEHFGRDDQSLLRVMTALEFGVVETERRKPHTAVYLSGLLFAVGSLPPVLPFVFVGAPASGWLWRPPGTGGSACSPSAPSRPGPPREAAALRPGEPGGGDAGRGLAYGVGVLFDRLVAG